MCPWSLIVLPVFAWTSSLANPDQPARQAGVQRFRSAATAAAKLPFSDAVRSGNLLFVSGQVGVIAAAGELRLVPGGIEPETRQALENVRTILQQAGSSLDRVVKCTVFLADVKEGRR